MKISGFVLAIALLGCLFSTAHAARAKQEKLIDIQSIEKAKVRGWVYAEGAGTRTIRAIEVKLKINKRGYVELPILCVYLFDRDKNLVSKLTDFFIKGRMRYEEPRDKFFKGKTTHILAFDYPNETKFKYFLVVVGVPGNIATKLSPAGANIKDFAFDEKSQIP